MSHFDPKAVLGLDPEASKEGLPAPHVAEFARFSGVETSEISANTANSLAAEPEQGKSTLRIFSNRKVAAGLAAIASAIGINALAVGTANGQEQVAEPAIVASPASITTSNRFKSISEVETDYNKITEDFPNAYRYLDFADYMGNNVLSNCGTYDSIDNISFGRSKVGSKKVVVKADIKNPMFTSIAVAITPSGQGDEDKVVKYSVPCDQLVDQQVVAEFMSFSKNAKGKGKWVHQSGTKEDSTQASFLQLPYFKYTPDSYNNGVSLDWFSRSQNHVQSVSNKFTIDLPKNISESDKKNFKVYPALRVITTYKNNMRPALAKDKKWTETYVLGPILGKSGSLKHVDHTKLYGNRGITDNTSEAK